MRGQFIGKEIGELDVLESLRRQIDAEARDPRPHPEMCQGMAYDPTVKLGHHPVVLEDGNEVAGRKQRLFLLAHSYQYLCHRVRVCTVERPDRLAKEGELVFGQCRA